MNMRDNALLAFELAALLTAVFAIASNTFSMFEKIYPAFYCLIAATACMFAMLVSGVMMTLKY